MKTKRFIGLVVTVSMLLVASAALAEPEAGLFNNYSGKENL